VVGEAGSGEEAVAMAEKLKPDVVGLLLAGVIIGSLGVLDDVTVTQTSAVWELHQADPGMGPRGLYRAGIRIGRDHIASVVNTLVLAYAGAALPLLLLFSIAQSSMGTVANSELVAEEIVRTLVGSIGLVASVPVTTALAALVVSADRAGATGRPGTGGRKTSSGRGGRRRRAK
ncbi:YibE/F family protein, partial [Streptomyces sp. NPDC006324]|uniref:YibE/F family protein n=1 Tax=Streptomyces sp. NPDC006324 TaxID=3156751 RepID=UPI0033A52918